MTRFLGLALAGLTTFSVSAMAQQPQAKPQRVRGTIASVSANTLTVTSRDGTAVRLTIGAGTHFASVIPSNLSAIKPGDFIGTATKGAGSHMQALEVVIFPASMRGTGEGHYPWDMLPNTANGAGAGGAPEVQSSMTNGTVSGANASSNGRMV
ncbi:MAG: metal ABC transporter permease, partial [Pseudomonadota bacterium]|nr:metal ABC transporter permease [Pseudomonadota bacterium]